jgi:hypothetical protein
MRQLLVPIAALVAPLAAEAAGKTASEAEHTRLAEEMRKLAQRNAWRGVEGSYARMLVIEKDGVVLTYDDHLLGAQAARALGDVTNVYDRLLRARSVKSTPEVTGWIADIEGSYSRVELARDLRYTGKIELTVDEMPFAPDQRAVIGAASQALATNGSYTGLLPFGGYSLSGKHFDVKQGGELVKVVLVPEGKSVDKAQTVARRDGLRADVGALYAMVGESSVDDSVQGQGFAGMGLRAGLGWELQVARPLGFVAQAGYHGLLFGEKGDPAAIAELGEVAAEPVTSRMSLFFVSGSLSIWPTDALSVQVGPSWAIGTAQTNGVSNGCVDATCSAVATYGADGSDAAGAQASIKSGGAVAGLFYGFGKTPGMKKSRSGISLQGGAQYDLARVYPWAQVAFAIAPSR